MSNRLVSIIVVTAGKGKYLDGCLISLKEQSYPHTETIAIDNSLKKDFSQAITKEFPSVKVYKNQNLFYCEALNKGIKASKGDFILCLNDDVVLDKDFIEKAMEGFAISEKVGMVSGKVLRFDKKTIDSTGLFLSLCRTARERGYGCLDRGAFNNPGYIFGVNGAVAFYRKEMLEMAKLEGEYFDSDFRFFYEDLDLAWRAHKMGWRGYYTPDAIAFHLRGATARQGQGINRRFARRYLPDELLFDLIKNRYLTIVKNETAFTLLLSLPFIIFYEAFAWGYTLFFRIRIIKYFFLKGVPLKAAFRKRKLLKKNDIFCSFKVV